MKRFQLQVLSIFLTIGLLLQPSLLLSQTSNIVFDSNSLSDQKLAATSKIQSELPGLLTQARVISLGHTAVDEMMSAKVSGIQDLVQTQTAIRDSLRKLIGDEADHIRILVFSGKHGPVFYVVRENGVLYRYTTVSHTEDVFFDVIKDYVSFQKFDQNTSLTIAGQKYYQEAAQVPSIIAPFIQECIDLVYAGSFSLKPSLTRGEEIAQKVLVNIMAQIKREKFLPGRKLEIIAEARKALAVIAEKIDSGKIKPGLRMRTCYNEQGMTLSDNDKQERRVGLYAIAGNPTHWGHILGALRAMGQQECSSILFVIQGPDWRKDMLKKTMHEREKMAIEMMDMFEGLFQYSSISMEQDPDALPTKDGETFFWEILELNHDIPLTLAYIVGDDHRHYYSPKAVKAYPDDKSKWDDTIAKFHKNVQSKSDELENNHHQVEVLFLEREGVHYMDIEQSKITQVAEEGVLKIKTVTGQFDASSTDIRAGIAGEIDEAALTILPQMFIDFIRANPDYEAKLIAEHKRIEAKKAGPIAKKVDTSARLEKLLEIDVDNGTLGAVHVIDSDHAKYSVFNMQDLQTTLKKLQGENSGIMSVVDTIRIVDTIKSSDDDDSDVVPYGLMTEDDGKNVLLLDVDAFNNLMIHYLVLDHELTESIMSIVPYHSEAVRELAANVMSLQKALTLIKEGKLKLATVMSSLSSLSADERFFTALEVLTAQEIQSDDVDQITAVALQHMREMDYYQKLFADFKVSKKLDNATKGVSTAKGRYEKVLSIFGDIHDAKLAVGQMKKATTQLQHAREKLNTVTGIDVPEQLVKPLRKVKMLASTLSLRETAIIDSLINNDKYIRLDVAELLKTPHITKWLVSVLSNAGISVDRQTPIVLYSSTDDVSVETYMTNNNIDPRLVMLDDLLQTKIDLGEIFNDDVITVLDLQRTQGQISDDSNAGLYLPLVYSVSSIYLAARIVLAQGMIETLKENDALAYTTLISLYKGIYGSEFTEENLAQMIMGNLPEIVPVTGILDQLHIALTQIEQAA